MPTNISETNSSRSLAPVVKMHNARRRLRFIAISIPGSTLVAVTRSVSCDLTTRFAKPDQHALTIRVFQEQPVGAHSDRITERLSRFSSNRLNSSRMTWPAAFSRRTAARLGSIISAWDCQSCNMARQVSLRRSGPARKS